MKNLDDIIVKMEQIDSLLYTLEGALPEENEDDPKTKSRLHNLFYLLLENFSRLQNDAEELNDHIGVCNAVFAVNRVEEPKQEIADLKGKLNTNVSTAENNDLTI